MTKLPSTPSQPATAPREPRARACSLAALITLTMLLAACAVVPTPTAPGAPVVTSVEPVAPASGNPGPMNSPMPSGPRTDLPAGEVAPSAGASSASDASGTAAEVPAVGPPTDPVRPEVPVDLGAKQTERDLWARVRKGFAMPDLATDLVREREQFYARQPEYFRRMTERSGRYLFHIVDEVERRGMPTELALLPFIESAFNPQAMSSAKASGMWQFIPSTGKHYDLTQNVFRDDRRDVLASTRAALDYLQKLHRMFGDWHLALAAYNWGEGSVGRAMAKNRAAGAATDYLSLSMPAETRHYVPKLLAMKRLIARPQDFGLSLPPLENHPYFLSVPIQRDIDSALVARLAGLPMSEFQALNPSLNRPLILAAGTPQVLLPYDNANAFIQALPRHRGALASWTAWTVPRTMKPAEAAKQAGMGEDALREINRIPPRMVIKAGSTLLVPRNEDRHADVSERTADHAVMHLVADAPPLKRSTVKARKGDSVASIAARYKLSAVNLASWNQVSATAKFATGKAVVVYLPAKSRALASSRSASAKVAKGGSVARKAAASKTAPRKTPAVKAATSGKRVSADKSR